MTSAARTSAGSPGVWRTIIGSISVREVEQRCAERGVRLDRARRTYWQAHGLFPLPEVRWLSRPGLRGGSRGYYHEGVSDLAVLLDAVLRTGPSANGGGPHWVASVLRRWRGEAEREASDPAAAEARFFARVRQAIARLDAGGRLDADEEPTSPNGREPNGRRWRPPRPSDSERPRWRTVTGSLTAAELERACGDLDVRLDRARRTYWQAQRLFPQPEVRWLSCPGVRGGARGYYHAHAPLLALVVDYALRPDHPAKRGRWRCSTPALGALLARWREEAATVSADPVVAEALFYERIVAAAAQAGTGAPIEGLDLQHRDVLPTGQRRVAEHERQAALRGNAAVVQAIADAWLGERAGEPAPDRLVVWFRLERDGPADWRIVDAGARRTSHEAYRVRSRARENCNPDDHPGI